MIEGLFSQENRDIKKTLIQSIQSMKNEEKRRKFFTEKNLELKLVHRNNMKIYVIFHWENVRF